MLDNRYARVPGVEYVEVKVSETERWRFAQSPDSLLPELLKELAEFRKAAKAAMKTAQGFEYDIQNARQLAFKISANRCVGRVSLVQSRQA